jgi:hypothetical protein
MARPKKWNIFKLIAELVVPNSKKYTRFIARYIEDSEYTSELDSRKRSRFVTKYLEDGGFAKMSD